MAKTALRVAPAQRVGGEYEKYYTPAWCVRRLLEQLELPGGAWLEPAAGDLWLVHAVLEVRGDVWWTTCDIRPESAARYKLDFLDRSARFRALGDRRWDVALINPPYTKATEFVEECLASSDDVVALLRLEYAASAERRDFLDRLRPDVYVIPDRPSFVDDGGSGISVYAWFHFGSRTQGGVVRYLATTPAAERAGRLRRRICKSSEDLF